MIIMVSMLKHAVIHAAKKRGCRRSATVTGEHKISRCNVGYGFGNPTRVGTLKHGALSFNSSLACKGYTNRSIHWKSRVSR